MVIDVWMMRPSGRPRQAERRFAEENIYPYFWLLSTPTPTRSATYDKPPSASTLRDRLHDITMIDVRTPGEFESVHLPYSRNRPLDELADHVDEIRGLRQAGREVVLVCRSGARAHRAQDQLAAAGLSDVPVLEGGVLAWQADDGPVVQGRIRWELERQVRLVAGGIVAASVAVSTIYPPARYVAGAVGVGLVVAASTNTCAMGTLLARLSYNRTSPARTG